MLSLASASLSFNAPLVAMPRANVKMESAAELKDLAKKLNPGAHRRCLALPHPLHRRRAPLLRLSLFAAQSSASGTR